MFILQSVLIICLHASLSVCMVPFSYQPKVALSIRLFVFCSFVFDFVVRGLSLVVFCVPCCCGHVVRGPTVFHVFPLRSLPLCLISQSQPSVERAAVSRGVRCWSRRRPPWDCWWRRPSRRCWRWRPVAALLVAAPVRCCWWRRLARRCWWRCPSRRCWRWDLWRSCWRPRRSRRCWRLRRPFRRCFRTSFLRDQRRPRSQ